MFTIRNISAVAAVYLLIVGSAFAAPQTQPTTQPATMPGPAAQPRDTLKNAVAAIQAGDADAFLGCFDSPTASQQKTLQTIVQVLHTAVGLQNAVADKFGKPAGDQVIAAFGGDLLKTNMVDSLPVTITSGNADVGQGPGAVHFVKIGDLWKVIPGPQIASATQFVDDADQQLPAVRTLTADVKAGKFLSANSVQSAVDDILHPKPDNGI